MELVNDDANVLFLCCESLDSSRLHANNPFFDSSRLHTNNLFLLFFEFSRFSFSAVASAEARAIDGNRKVWSSIHLASSSYSECSSTLAGINFATVNTE